MLRKPSTREGLACALFSDKGIESRKACGRSKVEHPFLIVKRRFDPLRKRYRGIEKTSCMLNVCLALANLTHVHLCRQAAPPGSQRRLICLGAFLPNAVHGAGQM
ncbi:hypothetical protein [Atopobium sp. oral taxon 416]|uniref:hypothetical protein n=1 Tax=Atopobium sp. oral taxon 416 TaxID=712157 RepID=UPI001BA81CAF|nr:hypothetical protein [Atopobium sp. oral taxon 416]QUC02034.1 hypothetical protein J4859_08125 [Atopobium sp. oral taxon 416]